MERRLHPRVTVQFEAKVTRLNNLEQSACGNVSDISNSGISVSLHLQFTPGDPVKVEMADSVLAGTVVYSRLEGTLFRTGVAVEKVLLGKTDLSNLLQRTLNEAMPETPGLDQVEAFIG